MTEDTESIGDDPDGPALATSGYVERTVLNQLVDADGRFVPTRVSDVLEPLTSVIGRGDYANVGPRNEHATVQRSSVRRTFAQLEEKGLVVRVEDLPAEALAGDRYALGSVRAGGDPTDPSDYTDTSDDARVTDWVLTEEGRAELDRLDDRYEAELDALAARFGRARGETTDRVAP